MKKVDVTKMFFGFLFVLVLALPGVAAADPTIAEVENQGDTLVFHPFVQFKELLLTVTGPCSFEYKQRVEEGEPYFRLDQTTIDGMYTYDLVRIEEVDPDIVKVLLEARQSFDEETPKQLCRDGKLPAAPLNQSASFRVFKGKIVYDPGAVEKAAGSDQDMGLSPDALASVKPAPAGMSRIPTKDFVINDDLIVDGSACIGFDCVNGESFSFDTIRLKENNLRIKFDDTSVAASFPRTDWQLTANASANGGASKFSIDDISGSRTPFTVEANARSHSLYVDDGGRIGNRTSTPSTEIHTIDGDTPTLRLQQDGSSGFAPQTWDVAGNETNFFIRDVTNGSTLPFRIRPGAPTSSIFIDVDGDVGMGTASPGAPLHVLAGGTAFSAAPTTGLLVQNNAAAGDGTNISILSGTDGSGQLGFGDVDNEAAGAVLYSHNVDAMRIFVNGSERIRIDSSGNVGMNNTSPGFPLEVGTDGTNGNGAHVTTGGVWTMGSSREFKENINELGSREAFDALASLNPVRFRYKLEPEEEYVGFIAEDVPELVATNSRKYLTSMDVVAVLTKVVKEQQTAMEEQAGIIEQLSTKLEALASQLED